MLLKEIIDSTIIHTISGETTVQEAAIRMSELNIGALLIGSPEKIEGIFSERDILKKVVSMDLPVNTTKLKDVMSKNITYVDNFESAHTALNIMKNKNFRHLPVIDEEGMCIGVIGIRKLMKLISENIEMENKALVNQIIDDKDWN